MDIYKTPVHAIGALPNKITIAAGPVIFDKEHTLVHIAPSTGKYQFIGGRIRDNESLQTCAVRHAKEDMGLDITLLDSPPFIVTDVIERDGEPEFLILFHYAAQIIGEHNIVTNTKYDWFTLGELNNMKEQLSTDNVLLATKHFLDQMRQD